MLVFALAAVAFEDLAESAIDARSATEIHSLLASLVKSGKAEGAALLIGRGNTELLRDHVGTITPETPVAIASATKWISSATLMAQVDKGLLTPESTVGEFVSGLEPDKARITLGQVLSFTSGLSDGHAEGATSLEAAALDILARDLAAPPGTRFAYGGPSLAVAGLTAERASGKPWATLYAEAVATPLQFAATTWEPENPPQLGGGITSNAVDYFRFLRMIANNGIFEGDQVLSSASITAMETNRVAGLEKDALALSIPGPWGYGLGLWCESVNEKGHCNSASSAGAFGTTPFVDRVNDYYGILVTHGSPADIVPVLGQVRLKLNAALATQGRL